MLGMYERIPDWMLDAEMIRECCYTMTVPFVSIPLARKNAEHAVPLFLGQVGNLTEDAAEKHLLLPQIYYLIFEASALEKSGNIQGAAAKLREVLFYAASDEVYMSAAEMQGSLKRIFGSMVLSKEERIVFAHIREFGEKQTVGVKKWKQMGVHRAETKYQFLSVLGKRIRSWFRTDTKIA